MTCPSEDFAGGSGTTNRFERWIGWRTRPSG